MNLSQTAAFTHPNSNDVLGDEIAELAAHIHAATYRFLVMIRQFDERKAWAEMGSTSCAHWLNWRCGINVHTAREKLRVAHALKILPKVSRAFEEGRLSFSKVRAVTRVASAENEHTLLNIALSGTAAQIERVVRCEMRCEFEDEVVKRSETAFEQRKFGWCKQSDGSVSFYGRLPAEMAEKLIAAVEENCVSGSEAASTGMRSDKVIKQERDASAHSNSVDVPAGTSQRVSAKAQKIKQTPLQARRADAVVALCESHCEGYEVTVHVPAGTSLHANSLKHAGTIPMKAAERMCCDAGIVPVIENSQGRLLDIGRRTRTIPPAILRALRLRDKSTCRFPGCTHTHFLQGHHIKHWAHGGKTSLDNLVLLCSKHHSLVHEGGFGCRAVRQNPNSLIDIVFSTPSGITIPDAFSLTAVNGQLEQRQQELNIGAYSCVATDAGSSMDTSCVIDALSRFRVKS